MTTEAQGARALAADPGSGAVQFRSGWHPRGDGGDGVRMTLGYRRCTDFDGDDEPGQDCAAGRSDGRYAVGIVTDGVSQSFFGDVAAGLLADGMLDLLWRRRADPPGADAVATLLRGLRAGGRRDVEVLRIPDHVPPMARGALEQMRDTHGSQAVFAAFVLDAAEGRAHVYTVGDAAAVVHGGDPGRPAERAPADPEGRWSTHGSPALGLHATVYEGVRAVVAHSDGAPGWGDDLAGATEERFQARAPAWAARDDVAFVAAAAEGGAMRALPLSIVSTATAPRLPDIAPPSRPKEPDSAPDGGDRRRPSRTPPPPRPRPRPDPRPWLPATRNTALAAAVLAILFAGVRATRSSPNDDPPEKPAASENARPEDSTPGAPAPMAEPADVKVEPAPAPNGASGLQVGKPVEMDPPPAGDAPARTGSQQEAPADVPPPPPAPKPERRDSARTTNTGSRRGRGSPQRGATGGRADERKQRPAVEAADAETGHAGGATATPPPTPSMTPVTTAHPTEIRPSAAVPSARQGEERTNR